MSSTRIPLFLFLVLGLSGAARPEAGDALAGALARFCKAEPEDRGAVAAEIVASGLGFQAVFERLEQGCRLPARVKRGRDRLAVENASGIRHPYLLLVPEDYDPVRPYPVRFFLHGGVNRPAFGPGDSWWRDPERATGDWISVFPASWRDSMWWHSSQVESLSRILDRLKGTYNVDENRVYMLGISDGGSGVYYQAMRAATPWAGFLPFIGSAAVVASPRHSDGDFHLPNLSNRPFFVVNGEDDRLYPVRNVEPGNGVVVRSAGVRRFRLLLSPRQFDLSLPVRVEVNGRVLHDDKLAPSLETLLRWAARDLDRSMLFAAELEIDL